MFFKIGVVKNFYNIHRKTPVFESLSNKVASLKTFNFIKKRLQPRCFPVNIAKFLRKALFKEHLGWVLLINFSLTNLCVILKNSQTL